MVKGENVDMMQMIEDNAKKESLSLMKAVQKATIEYM